MKVLVVIDMQHDFVEGVLGTPEARLIVGNVKRKVDTFLSEGGCVIYTQDTHEADYLHTQEGKNLPIEHCLRGTAGWNILPEIYRAGCLVIEKYGFGSLELAETVASMKEVECVELIGVCTDICVISNALILKSKLPEVKITVDASCCAGVTPESHANALRAMQMCQIEILP